MENVIIIAVPNSSYAAYILLVFCVITFFRASQKSQYIGCWIYNVSSLSTSPLFFLSFCGLGLPFRRPFPHFLPLPFYHFYSLPSLRYPSFSLLSSLCSFSVVFLPLLFPYFPSFYIFYIFSLFLPLFSSLILSPLPSLLLTLRLSSFFYLSGFSFYLFTFLPTTTLYSSTLYSILLISFFPLCLLCPSPPFPSFPPFFFFCSALSSFYFSSPLPFSLSALLILSSTLYSFL